MMYISIPKSKSELRNGAIGDEKLISYQWRVGNLKPGITFPNANVAPEPFDDVVEIQADGDELDYIRSRFTNLPDCSNARVIKWKGAFAQFIYDHLSIICE